MYSTLLFSITAYAPFLRFVHKLYYERLTKLPFTKEGTICYGILGKMVAAAGLALVCSGPYVAVFAAITVAMAMVMAMVAIMAVITIPRTVLATAAAAVAAAAVKNRIIFRFRLWLCTL